MEFKRTFENHVVGFGLTMIAIGFGSGAVAVKFLIDAQPGSKMAITGEGWEASARKANWSPRADCPAYPVSVSLTSPGSGVRLKMRRDTFYSDLVIQSTRAVPEASSIGLILNAAGDTNYYVIFPYLEANPSRTAFKRQLLELPFFPKDLSDIRVWTVLVADKSGFGAVYSSLDQVKAVSNDTFISSETIWKIELDK